MNTLADAHSTAHPKPGFVARFLLLLLRGYQLLLSPLFTFLGAGCRFHPTCSAYAVAVIRKDGAWRGSLRALSRLSRCHPWHPGGMDPP